MEADGIINRVVFAEFTPRVEYSLTEKGKSLTTIMQSLALWSADNIVAPSIKSSD